MGLTHSSGLHRGHGAGPGGGGGEEPISGASGITSGMAKPSSYQPFISLCFFDKMYRHWNMAWRFQLCVKSEAMKVKQWLTTPITFHSDVIRRCNCYSLSLDRKCYRHSLTFHPTPGSGGGAGEDSLDSSLSGHGGHHHQHSDSSPGGHHSGFKAGGFVSHAFTSVVNSTASNMGSDKSHSRCV